MHKASSVLAGWQGWRHPNHLTRVPYFPEQCSTWQPHNISCTTTNTVPMHHASYICFPGSAATIDGNTCRKHSVYTVLYYPLYAICYLLCAFSCYQDVSINKCPELVVCPLRWTTQSNMVGSGGRICKLTIRVLWTIGHGTGACQCHRYWGTRWDIVCQWKWPRKQTAMSGSWASKACSYKLIGCYIVLSVTGLDPFS